MKEMASPVTVDPERDTLVYQRYCHVYREGELELLFHKIPGLIVEESYYDTSNWCVRARRIF